MTPRGRLRVPLRAQLLAGKKNKKQVPPASSLPLYQLRGAEKRETLRQVKIGK